MIKNNDKGNNESINSTDTPSNKQANNENINYNDMFKVIIKCFMLKQIIIIQKHYYKINSFY